MKEKSFAFFVWPFVVWMAAVPAALAAFNYGVDPERSYRLRVPEATLRTLAHSEDLVLEVPANYNDRTFLVRALRAAPPAQTCVIGGSRVLNLSEAPSGGSFLNAGVTGGSFRDYIAIWQAFKEAGQKPRTVFLCLDPQSLDVSARNVSWVSLSRQYEAFYGREDTLRNRVTAFFVVVRDLTSWSTTLKSAHALGAPRAPQRLYPRAEWDGSVPVRRPSLAMNYPAAYEQKPLPEVERAALDNGRGERKAWAQWNWGPAGDRGFEGIRDLLRDIKAHGARPVLVLMPYHPLAAEQVKEDPPAAAGWRRFRERLLRLADEAGVAYYDGMEESLDGTLRPSDFADGVHLKGESNRAFLRRADRAGKRESVS